LDRGIQGCGEKVTYYSDEYPDSLDDHPDGPEGWRGDPFLGDCTIHIRYRKRRKYLCPPLRMSMQTA
jgi:hypothetical protein